MFLMGYGAFRFLVEFTREPDNFLGLLAAGLQHGAMAVDTHGAGRRRPVPVYSGHRPVDGDAVGDFARLGEPRVGRAAAGVLLAIIICAPTARGMSACRCRQVQLDQAITEKPKALAAGQPIAETPWRPG